MHHSFFHSQYPMHKLQSQCSPVSFAGDLNVTGTITERSNPAMPMNPARKTIVSANDNYTPYTLTWSFAFPDTNYAVNCNPVSSGTSLTYFQISGLTATTVTVQISSLPVGFGERVGASTSSAEHRTRRNLPGARHFAKA